MSPPLFVVVGNYAAMQAYEFDRSPAFIPSISIAFTLMVVLRLGSVVPQAPGNLGLFQFLTMEALQRMFHVVARERTERPGSPGRQYGTPRKVSARYALRA